MSDSVTTCQAPLLSTNTRSVLRFMSIEKLSSHLTLCHPFLLWPSIFSIIKVFSNEWAWFELHLCWILHAIAIFLDSLFFLIDLPDYAYANITLIMEGLDWHIYTIMYEIVSGKLLNNTGSPAQALWWPRGMGSGEAKEWREGRDIYVLYGYMDIYMYIYPRRSSGKEPACQCRRHKGHRFDPWVRKIPWRRAWQPTPVFLPGESHRQRSLAPYVPQVCKE